MLLIKNRNGYEIPYSVMNFSGGEVHFGLKVNKNIDPCTIKADLYSSNDIIELLMATDALRRAGCNDIRLICPYFPYARQDRVCNPGEALSVKVMADLINSQGYTSVEVWDAHSDVATALLDKCRNIHQLEFLKSSPLDQGCYFNLVAPDAGAAKKTHLIAKCIGLPYIVASKTRDTQTGEITNTDVGYILQDGRGYFIVDDICDGGRTFIEISKAVRVQAPRAKVHLYVTHGIFSNGFDELRKYIDHIYTANIWPDRYKGNEDYVTTLNRN